MVLWGSLGITLITQLYYLIFEFSSVGFSVLKDVPAGKLPPVSVVICARNELKNLKSFLPSILDQDYPEFQVVVVNDCSWDESSKYLEEMEDAFPVLKVVTLNEQEKYQHGKKFALTLGIKGAKYDHLLFTDADCQPAGNQWIRSMMKAYAPGKEIVVGYGAYFKEAGVLNRWIRFDTAQNALLFLSRAKKGKAYMGVGRNLSYVRNLFFKNKGFASHYHLMSGDDDLFVNETASPSNVAVVLDSQSFTYSKPKSSMSTWIWQKKRHMSSGKFYRSRDRSLIGIFFGSQFLFWLSVIASLILKLNPELVVLMVAIRLIVQMMIYWKGFKKLGETDLVFLVPFFDLFTMIIYPVLAVSNLFIKTKSWK
ncbi:glycosyltransferase [soil metagenome]